MQTLNRSALKTLKKFTAKPCPEAAKDMMAIPALHRILERELFMEREYSRQTLGVCEWMLKRGKEVLAKLLSLNGTLPPGLESSPSDASSTEIRKWEKVSRIYDYS
jgi:hypothetical protein